jgi:hypothetical protein
MNQRVEQQPQTRRELLCSAARCAALGGIAVFSAAMIVRGNPAAGEGECPLPQRATCSGCAALARCRLPAAAAARTRSEG